jgi:DNA-binding PadR family transcriptional regulator
MLEEEILKNMVRGFRELIILKLLSERPHHGYEILKRFEELFNVSYPTSVLYPILREMERKGYVQSEWKKTGERKKRLYALTSRGKDILEYSHTIMDEPAKKILRAILGE